MQRQVIPEPLLALDLIKYQLANNPDPLRSFVSKSVQEGSDLALIDSSMLVMLKTLNERACKFASIPHLGEDTWRSVIAMSKQFNTDRAELNPAWFAADTEEFLAEVLSPWLSSPEYELLIPDQSMERDSANDEFLIHAFSVVNVGVSFVRGVSATIPNYGDVTAIIGRLVEYFSLMEARGQEYAPFSWDDGS